MDIITASAANALERRSAARYPIVLNARYQALRKRSNDFGSGQTVDISSRGFLIASEHSIAVGVRLEVTVEWPVLLDGATELVLVANGQVVRALASSFALQLSRYEFRTTKRKFKAVAAGNGDYTTATGTGGSATSVVATAAAKFLVL